MTPNTSTEVPTEQETLENRCSDTGRLRELIDTMPAGYYRSTEEGKFLDTNQAFAHMLGYSVDELFALESAKVLYVDPADRDRFDRRMQFPAQPSVYRLRHRAGHEVWVQDYPRDRFDEGGSLICREGICEDITSRKRAEDKLVASLQEKEVLLREIHHRVKNNLQVVSSLLSLQRNRAADPTARQVLSDSQRRIKAIAMVHEKLYTSESLARVNFDDYMKEVASELCLFHDCSGIQFDFDVEPIKLDIDSAIPCGLVFNELLTNALKHGFPAAGTGTIRVTLRKRHSDQVELTVGHDGAATPADFDIKQPKSMGLLLVTSLVAQLGGEISVEGDGGTRFLVRFALS